MLSSQILLRKRSIHKLLEFLCFHPFQKICSAGTALAPLGRNVILPYLTMASEQTLSKMVTYQQREIPTASAWSPLRHPLFRALWIASIASSIGTWMHEAGAGWLMTSLTSSSFMFSLLPPPPTLPFFF